MRVKVLLAVVVMHAFGGEFLGRLPLGEGVFETIPTGLALAQFEVGHERGVEHRGERGLVEVLANDDDLLPPVTPGFGPFRSNFGLRLGVLGQPFRGDACPPVCFGVQN